MRHCYRSSVFLVTTILIVCLAGFVGQAQQIGIVSFDKLPQSYQLYPRNARNEAQLPVSGRIGEPGWQYVSVRLLRDKQPVAYRRAAVQYTDGVGRFAVDGLTIRAEKAQYELTIFAVKGGDSVNVVNRTNLVAGDVYVLMGQSNAGAFFRDTRTNDYCRTFGTITGTFGTEPYNPADTSWSLSNQGGYARNVGAVGFDFQKFILDNYGIPTCLINAAAHFSKMSDNAARTADTPTDPATIYGRMLYRVRKAGVAGAVKALIYRQGETEGYGESGNWPGFFDQFYRNLKTDLPIIQQLYVFQIDIINPGVAAAAPVREAQRTLPTNYPDIQVLASVGTVGFDGIHYSDEGYQQNGYETARLVGRDFYGATDQSQIDAPNLRRAYFSTAARDEITLLFNAGQQMVWNERRGSLLLRNFLYLDGQAGRVVAGKAVGNRIVLTLDGPSNATRIGYLPTTYDEKQPDYPFQGPYLTNGRGMRALAFHDVPIAEPGWADAPIVATPTLTAMLTGAETVRLTWPPIPGATGYVLERRDGPSTLFQPLTQLSALTTTYLSGGLQPGTTYTFRIKTLKRDDESAYSSVDISTAAPLAQPTLKATAIYANVVGLTWSATADATGYVLERRLAGETAFSPLAMLPPDRLSLTDSLLNDGQAYVYRIKATGRFSDSPYAVAEVQTPAYLPAPPLSVTVVYNNALRVGWQAVAGATRYRLERKTGDEPFHPLTTVEASVTALNDADLQPGTTYTYRIRALGDRTESPVATATAQTPALLTTPTLALTVVYNNRVQLAWANVPGATGYELFRKTGTESSFKAIGTVEAARTTLSDTNLLPGTTYTYQLKALGDRTESLFGTATVQTPALLTTPVLSATVVYNNALRIGWEGVPNATGYRLERKATTETDYRVLGTFGAAVRSVSDTLLVPGTTYLYRLKAFGDRTESPVGSLSIATPARLATPELTVTPVSFDTLRLSWKAVPNAVYYRLERRKKGEDTYLLNTRLDPPVVGYVDVALSPSTAYQYRLTAFGDLTQSEATTGEATTLMLLATEPPATFSLWPNPARGRVTLRFEQPTSGSVQVVDLRGVVQKRQPVEQATEVVVALPDVPPGTYLIRVERGGGVLARKLLVE